MYSSSVIFLKVLTIGPVGYYLKLLLSVPWTDLYFHWYPAIVAGEAEIPCGSRNLQSMRQSLKYVLWSSRKLFLCSSWCWELSHICHNMSNICGILSLSTPSLLRNWASLRLAGVKFYFLGKKVEPQAQQTKAYKIQQGQMWAVPSTSTVWVENGLRWAQGRKTWGCLWVKSSISLKCPPVAQPTVFWAISKAVWLADHVRWFSPSPVPS